MGTVGAVLSPAERSEIAVQEVRAVLSDADPEGLLGLGAPADEYDDLVLRVAGVLLRNGAIEADALFGSVEDWRGEIARDEVVVRLRSIQRRVAE